MEKGKFLKVPDDDPRIGMTVHFNIATARTERVINPEKDILKLTTVFSLALEGD